MQTKKFKVDKLVRDKFEDVMQSYDIQYSIRTMDIDEFVERLKLKLIEESCEVGEAESPDETLEELSDVCEVVYSLTKALGYSLEDLENKRLSKKATFGGFDQRIYSENIVVHNDNPHLSRYESRPHKYQLIDE